MESELQNWKGVPMEQELGLGREPGLEVQLRKAACGKAQVKWTTSAQRWPAGLSYSNSRFNIYYI